MLINLENPSKPPKVIVNHEEKLVVAINTKALVEWKHNNKKTESPQV